MFVTALYKVYADGDAVGDRLLRDFDVLARHLGDELIVFADEHFHPRVRDANVRRVLRVPIGELAIYNEIVGSRPALPPFRNADKDTLEYLALMNTKVEFLARALPYADGDLMWLDAGVNKVFRHPGPTYDRLQRLAHDPRYDVVVGGCHQDAYSREQLAESVRWNFLGGFIMLKRAFVAEFMERNLASIRRFLARGAITWEVNVWIDVFQAAHVNALWYRADHDDSLACVAYPP